MIQVSTFNSQNSQQHMSIVSGPYQRFSVSLGQIVSHVSNNLPRNRINPFRGTVWLVLKANHGASVCVCALASYSSTLHIKWSCKHKSQLQTA